MVIQWSSAWSNGKLQNSDPGGFRRSRTPGGPTLGVVMGYVLGTPTSQHPKCYHHFPHRHVSGCHFWVFLGYPPFFWRPVCTSMTGSGGREPLATASLRESFGGRCSRWATFNCQVGYHYCDLLVRSKTPLGPNHCVGYTMFDDGWNFRWLNGRGDTATAGGTL
jgi:hypothetical protein